MIDSHDGKQFHFDAFQLDILVHGYPGKSVCHGSLGFSTIALLRHEDAVGLVDVGSFGQRRLLMEQLAAHDLVPAQVTHVLLSHSHYDHAINWTLFPNAKIFIAKGELDWALEQPWGETPVPELYVRELSTLPRLQVVGEGEQVFPGTRVFLTPGHTPGSAIFVMDVGDRSIIFTGDACKNRAELLSRSAHMSLDQQQSQSSIERIWAFWSERPGNILVPGHDLPMVLEESGPRYLGEREAAIDAWFGEDLNETTVLSLLP